MRKEFSLYPAVSVALCSYNGAKFIQQQIESILNQTYSNIVEIICVDDGSTDETVRILEQLKAKDDRIIIIQNQTNLGYIKNFEKALSLATSPFVAVADQDDIWYLYKIERLMDAIGDRLMVYSDSEYIDDYNHKVGKKLSDFRHLGECNDCLSFALLNVVSGHTIIFRKELLSYALPFHPKVAHDHWLAFHAAKHGAIAFVDEPLVGYRQHANNVLGAIGVSKNTLSDPNLDIYERLEAFIDSMDNSNPAKKQIFEDIADVYQDFSFRKKLKKVHLFLKYNESLLYFKKRNKLRKLIYCLKMFWRVI